MRRFALIGLPVILFVAFAALELPVWRARQANPPQESLILDAESAWHARRVTLALSGTRLPQSDRFLAHPEQAPYVDPPLFDFVLSLAAGGLMGDQAGGPGEGPPDEERLERLLSQVGPVLFMVLLGALFFATRRGGGALAIAIIALSPQLQSACLAGRIEVEAFAAVLLALGFGLARSAWSTEDSLDRLQAGLLAGLVTGVGLASTPLFGAAAIGLWGGFVYEAWRAEGDAARDRARAGLLFTIAAILPAQLPTMNGPWLAAADGPVAEWTMLSSGFLVLGCLAFAAAFGARSSRRLSGRGAMLLVAFFSTAWIALLLFAAPGAGFARPLRAALRLDVLPGEALGSGLIPAASPWGVALGLALWVIAMIVSWRGLRATERGANGLFLATAGGLGLLFAFWRTEAGLLFLVPVALALDDLMMGEERPALSSRGKLGLLCAALAFGVGLVAFGQRAADELRTDPAASDAVAALRWLRRNSEPSGAWSSAGAGQDYGVLAAEEISGLIPYHARRPALAVGARAGGAPEAQRAARSALHAESVEELARRASILGARYIVLNAAQISERGSALRSSRWIERIWPPADRAAVEIYRITRPAGVPREAQFSK